MALMRCLAALVMQELGGWAEDDAYAVQDWELLSAATLRGFKVRLGL